MPDPAHLSLYMEDDLDIDDPYFFDKLVWFHHRTDHKFILMPHRREVCSSELPRSLYVDGPIKEKGQAIKSA